MGDQRVDALLKRQSVTESSYNNSLADHHIWSTIKTLPANLPEPSSKDRGPRTGVTGAVSASDLDLCLFYRIILYHLLQCNIVVFNDT